METGTGYDDGKWQQHSGYQDMASFGWPNGYGWYRAAYTASAAGMATFSLINNAVQDTSYLFVNGVFSGPTMSLRQGANTIAVLAADYSRYKEYNYYGPPRDIDRSGIINGISVNGAQVTALKFRGGFDGLDESPLTGNISDSSWNLFVARSGWSAAAAPADNLPKFWRYDFNYTPPTNALQTWDLNAPVARAGRGVVWLNGHNIGRTIDGQWPLFVPQCWLKAGNNTFVALTEDGRAPSNWSLAPVEYRSFVSPAGTSGINSRLSENNSGSFHSTKANLFIRAGGRFDFPASFRGKRLSVAVYSLSGKLLFQEKKRENGINDICGGRSGVLIAKIVEEQ